MKKLFALPILLILMIGSYAQSYQALAIGSSIPMQDTKMKSISGKEVSIKDVVGKNGVLVMFSCNTCPYVVKYQSRTLKAIFEAKNQGFGVIIINSNETERGGDDSFSAMQAYSKAQGYKEIPYVVDANSAVANAFGATRTPECFLFNASGKLVYHGAIDDSPEMAGIKRSHLALAISETVAGKDVSVKESRSLGCMIKRKTTM